MDVNKRCVLMPYNLSKPDGLLKRRLSARRYYYSPGAVALRKTPEWRRHQSLVKRAWLLRKGKITGEPKVRRCSYLRKVSVVADISPTTIREISKILLVTIL